MPFDSRPTALIIDHDDSFIWNIKAWLSDLFKVKVINHRQLNKINFKNDIYDLIIFSPGPKSPINYPHSIHFLNQIDRQQPVLGICLGWQMMVFAEGGEILNYQPVLHGKTSCLVSENLLIHKNVIARYHSLITKPSNSFKIIATSDNDHHVMWGQHNNKKQMGFQFHPESFLTEKNDFYLNHVLSWMKL